MLLKNIAIQTTAQLFVIEGTTDRESTSSDDSLLSRSNSSDLLSLPSIEAPARLIEAAESSTSNRYIIPTGFLIDGVRITTSIDCDFKLKEHPDLGKFIDYAYRQGIVARLYPEDSSLEKRVKDKIRASYFVQLAVNTLPESTDQNKLKAMVNWILLLFAFDNVIDSSTGKIPQNEDILKRYTAILSEKVQGDPRHDEDALTHYLKREGIPSEEIEQALKPFRLASFLANETQAFHTEARRYFESSLLEMYKPKAMNLNRYLSVRKESGAIDSVVRLAEEELPDYFLKSAYFTQMNSSIVDYIWAVNDLGGAKEFVGHEPAYLKIQARTHYNEQAKKASQVDKPRLQIASFETSLNELLVLINDSHEFYFHGKKAALDSIRDGSIFNQSQIEAEFKRMSATEQDQFKGTVENDFLRRCDIRENLAAAGNECTRISTRYIDFRDPSKNLDLSVPWTL